MDKTVKTTKTAKTEDSERWPGEDRVIVRHKMKIQSITIKCAANPEDTLIIEEGYGANLLFSMGGESVVLEKRDAEYFARKLLGWCSEDFEVE